MTAVTVATTGAEARPRPVGWWGMVIAITTEATIFASLLGAYFFIRASSPRWPPAGIEAPKLDRISVFTVVLLASSIPVIWAEVSAKRGQMDRVRAALAISFLLGLAFLVHQAIEYQGLTFGARDNAYGSLFYVITGLHGLHVLIGLLMNVVVQAKAWTGRITADRHLTLQVFAMYWHFVDLVWIFVFSSLYLSAHIQ
jgi:heme/copper-type cytochrome/quinol oxidase subunit 3